MFLQKCRLINCQAMEDITINFSSGLNVLIGDNSDGKSIFFKMLKIACGSIFCSVRDLRHLITYGKSHALALFYLSDNSVGGVKINCNSSVEYIYATDQSSLEIFSSPHPNFLHKMSIVQDSKENFILNILDNKQELIFIDSKDTTNYAVVKLLSDREDLEHLILDEAEFRDSLASSLDFATTEYNFIKNDYDKIEFVDCLSLQDTIETCSPLLSCCKRVVDIYEQLSSLKSVKFPNFSKIFSLLDLLDKVCEVEASLSEIKPVNPLNFERILSLLDCVDKLSKLNYQLYLLKNSLAKKRELQYSLKYLYDQIGKLTVVVECPMKGKVFYFDDGECISCDI